MAKTYAAFYLPPEEKEVKVPNQENVDRIRGTLIQAKNKAKLAISETLLDEMSGNIDLQSTTEFVQRYAVGAMTKIINGEPVTNKTMLDSLFNTYAPALNAGLAQTGFNSLVEMRNAAQAGNGSINVANFIQGFSNGLSIVQAATEKIDYSKYGEEIPIDVIDEFTYTYKTDVAQRTIDQEGFLPLYIDNLDPVVVTMKAHVKNENAELWNMNDFGNKIVDVMQRKEKVTFRVGKSIYENCIICKYFPTITSIYDLYFEADINIDYRLNTQSEKGTGGRVMNPSRLVGDFNFRICSEEVYKGIIA